jgi:predicted nucleotidyltransferase
MEAVDNQGKAGVGEKIREMARRIAEQFSPEKIILFGSHARGDAGPDSDVDLLVVMSGPGSERERTIGMRMAVRGLGLAKDICVVTADDIDRYRDVLGTIIKPALSEGKVLYERA